MVRKKDQSFRFCIDMRALNRITVFDEEPMPCIEDMFSKITDNKYISRLDQSKGIGSTISREV